MSRDVAIRFVAKDAAPGAAGAPPARLDRFLASRFPALSRADFARLIASGGVLVDGRCAPKGLLLRDGQEIRLTLPEARARWIVEPDPTLRLAVHFEDPHLVCVEKPPGIPCLPIRPDERGTVANGLVARYPELNAIGKPLEAGLVHRLDTGTSGLLVAARTPDAHERMRAAWRAGEVTKIYLAVVRGAVREPGRIEAPIAAHPKSARRMIVARDPADSEALATHTEYEPIRVVEGRTLLRVRLVEGRRHQIRVHLASIGHPVVGDAVYGRNAGDVGVGRGEEGTRGVRGARDEGRSRDEGGSAGGRAAPESRLALHAHRVTLPHPETGRPLSLESPLPADLAALLEV